MHPKPHPPRSQPAARRALLAAAIVAILVSAPLARAMVDVQTFNPAASSSYVYTEDAFVNDSASEGTGYFFSAMYSWTDSPLVVLDSAQAQQLGTLVSGLNTLDLTAGWNPAPGFSLNATLPLNLVNIPNNANQFALSDSRVWAKIRLTSAQAAIAVSLMPELFVPTGAQNLYLSSGTAGAGAGLALERDFGGFQAAANVGFRYNPGNELQDLNYAQLVPMSLGLNIPLSKTWAANLEASGAVALPPNRYNNPGEAYAGLRTQLARDAVLTAGVAAGAVNSVNDSTDVRVIAGIKLTPFAPKPIAETPIVVHADSPVAAPGPRVIFTPKEIQLLEEVKFQHDSALLTDSGRNLLDEVAEVLRKNRESYRLIVIEGHANVLGTYAYNQRLSEFRAESVKEYLVSRGIPSATFASIGYGKTRPKELQRSLPQDVVLAANRRVQFKIVR